MYKGFLKAAAITPNLTIGSPYDNADAMIAEIKKAAAANVDLLVLPELATTAYTVGDLINAGGLVEKSDEALKKIAKAVPVGMLVFVGAPVSARGNLYNAAVAMNGGKILWAVPKTNLPNYNEFYEKRFFALAPEENVVCESLDVPLGTKVLFTCRNARIAAEICEDMWVSSPPSSRHSRAGANVVVNLSASDEFVDKAEFRRTIIRSLSGRCTCGYVYSDAGMYESSGDLVFAAHNIIAEGGAIIKESELFGDGICVTEIDLNRIDHERRKFNFTPEFGYTDVKVELYDAPITLGREIPRLAFVPDTVEKQCARAEFVLNVQTHGLKKRVEATRAKSLVVGLSGGLDSALALIVAHRVSALTKVKVLPVSMPAFGTTSHTKESAELLAAALGLKLETIDVKDTVNSHLSDIDHKDKDVTYENAQARVRTLTLFDYANKHGGLVVGTGDLSELALGWCTFNGDHMASYGVNAGVPKTLIKCVLACEGNRVGGALKAALDRIIATDISPELLPPENGKITQKTEDIVGSYEFNDFVMYYFVRFGMSEDVIAFLAAHAFKELTEKQIESRISAFMSRFYANQFKRNCAPDAPKIGSVSLSPHGDWRMPSDAVYKKK